MRAYNKRKQLTEDQVTELLIKEAIRLGLDPLKYTDRTLREYVDEAQEKERLKKRWKYGS